MLAAKVCDCSQTLHFTSPKNYKAALFTAKIWLLVCLRWQKIYVRFVPRDIRIFICLHFIGLTFHGDVEKLLTHKIRNKFDFQSEEGIAFCMRCLDIPLRLKWIIQPPKMVKFAESVGIKDSVRMKLWDETFPEGKLMCRNNYNNANDNETWEFVRYSEEELSQVQDEQMYYNQSPKRAPTVVITRKEGYRCSDAMVITMNTLHIGDSRIRNSTATRINLDGHPIKFVEFPHLELFCPGPYILNCQLNSKTMFSTVNSIVFSVGPDLHATRTRTFDFPHDTFREYNLVQWAASHRMEGLEGRGQKEFSDLEYFGANDK